ncbi:hypothetical protein NEMIN01_1110 [Nematocida minor]|uniref:uncharacterized protein n=1 Tax=Nematocida minor TaxID=1912983 RepID=UPI0022211A44|nr:uncharacterized protein NEMIN01_1110 [Nematocida minor]KAI5190572.1 hypothetical protein NEMIN01_1110 [Nematocida minor]
MHIKEIWPEPPLGKRTQEPPRIPKTVEAFQRTIGKEKKERSLRSLGAVLSDIVEIFTESASNSTSIKKVRDIKAEVKKIENLYEEANSVIAGYREKEAQERVIALVKKQIKQKQNLINKLNLKEKEKNS